MQGKLLYSREETSRLLSVSLRKIDSLIASGRLKTQRLGRRRLVLRDRLEEFAR
jgi:excisionase family DNA binding protein